MPETARTITNSDEMLGSLSVGNHISVQKEVGSERQAGQIAGWVPEEFLLLKIAPSMITTSRFFAGNLILARYLERGVAYGFKTKVFHAINDVGLLVLSWPTQMEVVPVGSSDRVRVHYPIKITAKSTAGPEVIIEAGLSDISPSGCRVHVARKNLAQAAIHKSDPIRLSMTLPNQETIEDLQAEVRNIQPEGDSIAMGLLFDPSQSDKLAKLNQVIKQQLQI
ncbi:MAG: PilZ domain-containing protein [Desulfarculus sp.]|nr:PilZ domain-containing protein [Desulfarculus sp.]